MVNEESMKNIKLTIQFDGTSYHGWQTQLHEKTVQQTLQDVLSQILNQPVKIHGSGRTDAGVHALGQVAHFTADTSFELNSLKKSVNRLLPQDIVVAMAEEAPLEFHSRYDATARVYWYFIWNARDWSPFYSRYSWHIMQPLDLSAMKEAAKTLIGIHDFSSFQGADKNVVNPVRQILSVQLKKVRKDMVLFEIQANAFLKHMVRNITGTLVDAGRGKLTPEGFKEILEKRDRQLASATAPAQGLFLKKVKY